MSWSRKNDEMRLYLDETEGAYLLVFPSRDGDWIGNLDAVANVYPGSDPSLVYCSIDSSYLTGWDRKRVAWNDLPPEWQEAFRQYMAPRWEDEPAFEPESIRGLWRMGEQPVQVTA